ncbi:DUF4407 domain-containing protein [Dactylosporangium vinaceum]|uniref:DUF4407 domain-containing protein n=1 Tax=Dactylosporangium vinaceum TaxID=53362 RepID=A0ABV5M0D7_9ACTN|nr:DUF4407 domain-containing protein [Dactylosporangium vinaceum]UAB97407.1 DUF4407 domain-containing protein [Dactylosporangium vinaceum]
MTDDTLPIDEQPPPAPGVAAHEMTGHEELGADAAEAPPRWGPGRLLRLCTGVDESVLSGIASERPRYTAMGGVVFGTAAMAMGSMTYALMCVFDGFRLFTVGVVIVWGLFILSLDRWMMAGGPIRGGSGAWRKVVPRLMLSIALGVIVAEPLLLGVFHTAIQERVDRDRATEITDRESKLRDCNPTPGTPDATSPAVTGPACDGYRLVIDGSPESIQQELTATEASEKSMRANFDADAKTHADLQEKARLECNGTPGAGLTGNYGEGVNCKRLRKEADDFYAAHQMAENNQRLNQLTDKIKKLNEDLANARQHYADNRNVAIGKELDKIRARHKGVGLLERFAALHDLVGEDSYVQAAQWGLRIFLIVVDMLPVLLKAFTGETPYDRVVAEHVRRREELEKERTKTRLLQQRNVETYRRRRSDLQGHAWRRTLSQELRVQLGRVDADRQEMLAARERLLLRAALGPAIAPEDPEDTQELIIEPTPGGDR